MLDHRRARMGQPYWLKSEISGQLDNKSYIITQTTNIKDIKLWIDRGMLYVPASDLDLKKLNNYKPVIPQPIAQGQLHLSQP